MSLPVPNAPREASRVTTPREMEFPVTHPGKIAQPCHDRGELENRRESAPEKNRGGWEQLGVQGAFAWRPFSFVLAREMTAPWGRTHPSEIVATAPLQWR